MIKKNKFITKMIPYADNILEINISFQTLNLLPSSRGIVEIDTGEIKKENKS